MLEEQKAEAQQALDELYREGLLPFQLSAYRVKSVGLDEYIVHFNDSRLHSVDLSWQEGQSFKDVFRVALFERLIRLKALGR